MFMFHFGTLFGIKICWCQILLGQPNVFGDPNNGSVATAPATLVALRCKDWPVRKVFRCSRGSTGWWRRYLSREPYPNMDSLSDVFASSWLLKPHLILYRSNVWDL